MDIGRPIIEYQRIDIRPLHDTLKLQDASFWALDQSSRTVLANDRPGRAVYYYSDQPHFVRRAALSELRDHGRVSVLRNACYAMFDLVEAILRDHVLPLYEGCDVLRVQLAELPAGQRITGHRDDGILAAVHRLHIPIETSEDVVFRIDRRDFVLARGVLYELNNVVQHSVTNDGASTRVHLLIDLLPHALGRAIYHDDRKTMAVACLT